MSSKKMRSMNVAGAFVNPKGIIYEFEMPIPHPKCCLRDINLPNSQLMVTGVKVYLRVDSCHSQLIQNIINPR